MGGPAAAVIRGAEDGPAEGTSRPPSATKSSGDRGGAHAAGESTPGTARRRIHCHRHAAYSANWRSTAGAIGQAMSGVAWMPV